MTVHDSRIARLIEELELPNPDDEFPAATRGVVQLLRTLEENGVVEMLEAINAGMLSALLALRVIAPSTTDAIGAFFAIVDRNVTALAEATKSKQKGTS